LEKFGAYYQRAQSVARVLSAIPGISVKPDPPQTNMMHVYIQCEAEALLEACAAIARTERVLLFRRLIPIGAPGVAAFELAIGDAAEAITDQEIGAYFGHLMAKAGA
jgi:hypothetical protein